MQAEQIVESPPARLRVCIAGHFGASDDSAAGARVAAYGQGLAQFGITADAIGCIREGPCGAGQVGNYGTMRLVKIDGASKNLWLFSFYPGDPDSRSRLRSAYRHLTRLLAFWVEVTQWLRRTPSGMLVLYGHEGPMLAVAAVVARIYRRQVILDVTEWFERSSRHSTLDWTSELVVQRVVPRLATHASVISEEAARRLPAALPRTVVTSMISSEWASEIAAAESHERNAARFMCVFSGSENRGVQNLIFALDDLAAHHPSVVFELRITGKQKTTHAVEISPTGRLDIQRMGSLKRENYAALLKQADCLVIPGDVGTDKDYAFPNRLPEYLISGTPTILAGYPAAARRLRHQKEAVLLSSSDPELLAGAIEKILLDVRAAHALGRAGREAAERLFDPGRVVKSLVEDLFGPNR